mmetsp:Transcript_28482/g.62365  ORF Transcript_28482/g.62365 Transcript_28482/m.62365 type:complete len:396 (-) Transcript_28482:192-1379(-)
MEPRSPSRRPARDTPSSLAKKEPAWRCSQVEVLLPGLAAHLLELLEDAAVVVVEVAVEGGGLGGVHVEQLVRLLHGRAHHLVVGQHVGEGQAVGRVARPLEGTRHRLEQLQRAQRHLRHLGLLVGLGLAQLDHLGDGVGVGAGEGDGLADGLLRAQRRQGHARRVLGVEVGGLGGVVGAPHGLLLQDGDGVLADQRLHEPAHAEHRVRHLQLLQVLLRAPLHVHQRHLGVLLAAGDGEEEVALDAHGLGGLDQRLLALPIYRLDGLLRARGGAIDDGVNAHKRGGKGLRLGQVRLHGDRAPVAQEISRVLTGAHDAAHIVPLVQGAANNLAPKGAGGTDHHDAGPLERGSGRSGGSSGSLDLDGSPRCTQYRVLHRCALHEHAGVPAESVRSHVL